MNELNYYSVSYKERNTASRSGAMLQGYNIHDPVTTQPRNRVFAQDEDPITATEEKKMKKI